MLYVMLLPGTSLAADALSGWFRQYMTHYRVPSSSVKFVLDSPANMTCRGLIRPMRPFNGTGIGHFPTCMISIRYWRERRQPLPGNPSPHAAARRQQAAKACFVERLPQ